VDPSDRTAEVLDVLREFRGLASVHVNGSCLGVAGNPEAAMSRAFGRGADFVMLAEEDIVVSDDILEYFEWADRTFRHDKHVLAVCARSKNAAGHPQLVTVEPRFEVQGWGTWARQWESVLAPTWDFDYSTYNGAPGNEAGWDWNIATRVLPERQLKCVLPAVSRVSHIGLDEGVHTSPESFKADASPTFEAHRPSVAYRVA
jgi:hypothetical protein